MKPLTPSFVSPTLLKKWLHDGQEIALLDVREHGQYGEEHLFYVVSTPYSKLESEVLRLAPRKNVRMVLVGDSKNDLSIRANQRLLELGYSQVHILDGGVAAWRQAGYEVFAGVNLPSKAFGELAEHAFNTPRISALELNEKIANKEDVIVLDGRPYQEFKKMSIPTAMCCPNGELALRIDDIVKNPDTTIVINCAGRTRSIIGAQTLINLGLPNKILALENGTQGWYLADLKLEHGKTSKHPETIDTHTLSLKQQRARELALKHKIAFVDGATVERWLKEKDRTTYLCDVRTPEEFAQQTVKGAQHTPGGQLVQATDQYIGTKGARIVVFDQENVRAPAMASWLAMLGWDVAVWDGALNHQWSTEHTNQSESKHSEALVGQTITAQRIAAEQISQQIQAGARVLDMRPSMKYREAHIQNAVWTIRPLLHSMSAQIKDQAILVLAEEEIIAQLATKDLVELGAKSVSFNVDPPSKWSQVKLRVRSTPEHPSDKECIDYLFFVHDRHDGNKAAARQYLAWEMNLLAQIDEQEKAAFKLPH